MDDLISRQAAIDELDKGAWGVEWDKTLAKTMIESLPSAQQERIIYGNMSDEEFEKWLYGHGICSPNIREPIPCSVVPLLIDNAISELPSAQPEQRWIPVAERMPEDEGPYLVYGDFPDNGYLIAYAKRILNWKKMNFFIAPFWNSPSEVIHAQAWCKLPSPYRAERSNS